MLDFDYILLIALGQGILLAFFLLSSKYYKTSANSWLALALILLSVNSIKDIIGHLYPPNSILLEFFTNDLELSFLIYIPLLYFFKCVLTDPINKVHFNYYLLIPFIIDTIINVCIVSYIPLEVIETHSGVQLFYEIENITSIIFNLFLSYKSYQLIKNTTSDNDKRSWINKVWVSTFILLLAWTLLTLGSFVINAGLETLVFTLYLIISIWMFWMIYNGIVNLKLIDDRKNISLILKNKRIQKEQIVLGMGEYPVVQKKQEVHSNQNNAFSLNSNLFEQHFHRLHELIISEALYRNENLSIGDIAQRVDMSSGYVSKIIKKTTNKNFPSWINEFRVEDAKVMFEDEAFNHYTTLSIGLEAGFKSKSTFYAAFKRITGETPAKFRKKKS